MKSGRHFIQVVLCDQCGKKLAGENKQGVYKRYHSAIFDSGLQPNHKSTSPSIIYAHCEICYKEKYE